MSLPSKGDKTMAKFAPVAPIWLARKLNQLEMLGDYHLLLAHDVVKHPGGYAEVFGSNFRLNHRHGCIILDNSLIELGHPADDDMMLEATAIVNPNVVVLPDYAHDMERTIDESSKAYNRWRKIGLHTDYMGVAQGNTLDEYVKCATTLTKLTHVNHIGIPRNAVSKLHSRFQLIQKVREETSPPWPEIHMLGFSEDVLDDVTCASLPFIKGIDSAVPLRAGLENMWLTSPFSYIEYTSKRNSYWHEPREVTAALVQNIQRLRQWLQVPNR